MTIFYGHEAPGYESIFSKSTLSPLDDWNTIFAATLCCARVSVIATQMEASEKEVCSGLIRSG